MLESVTVSSKLYVPGVVGTPEIAPVAACNLSPGGSFALDTFHASGCVPPATPIVICRFDPTFAEGKEDVLIVSDA